MEYRDLEYAQTKLVGGLAMLNGRLVHVNEISMGSPGTYVAWVSVYEYDSNEDTIIESLESTLVENLDLETFQIGYVNLQKDCRYVTRLPARGHGYKQTIREGVLIYDYRENLTGLNKAYKNILKSIYNIYPDLSVVRRRLHFSPNKVVKQAFSKKFCLDNQHQLYWKGMVVGKDDGSKLILNPEFMWLEKRLENAYEL